MKNRAAPKLWKLDGEPVDVFEFMEANDLASNEVRDILEMQLADQISWGGGAAPIARLVRTR